MAKEFRTRVFKSGNSCAVRLPRELGFVDGEDIVIVPHRDGSISFWKEGENLKILMNLYGEFSAGFMADGRGEIDQDAYDWERRSEQDRAA